MIGHSRREFLGMVGYASGTALFAGQPLHAETPRNELDDFIEAERRAKRIPGLTACVVKSGGIAWSKGYGWANIAKRIPMHPDLTVQNIGSVSKTLVATAVMQLWEKGRFQLDDDINGQLPFSVRNPSHPDAPITYRQLLTHRSGIADGPAYSNSYACGDPKLSLEAWLKAYLIEGGQSFNKKANFHPWKPGEKHAYSNIGFGLLAYLVERMSGQPFTHYTRSNIFEPLGMKRTGWLLSEIDVASHAVPYAPVLADGQRDEEMEAFQRFGLLAGDAEHDSTSGDQRPLCLYNFPNYPDGSLRTSVHELARFLLAYIKDGTHGGGRILAADTIKRMLSSQGEKSPHQGLCWASESRDGQKHWGHNGSDPGIRTSMSFRPSDGVGVIVFVNRSGVDLGKISGRLFQEASRL